MALVIKLRANERLIVNGALIRNAGENVATLHLLNRANVLHEKDILLPEHATSPLEQLYVTIQNILLEEDATGDKRANAIKAAALIYASAITQADVKTCTLITEVIRLIGENDIFKALRQLKSTILHHHTE